MQEMPDVELLGPPPFKWGTSLFIWLAAIFVLSLTWFGVGPARIGTSGNSWLDLWLMVAVVIGFTAAGQIAQFMGRDIVLSVEGVRKGKKRRSVFIPWRGATFYYDLRGHRYTVAAKGARITFNTNNFADPYRYREIVGHIQDLVHDQGLQRNAHAPKTNAPIHRLSTADRAAFLAYRGDAFLSNVILRYLALPIFITCLFYFGFIVLLVYRPPLPPAARQVVNSILRAFPILFHGHTAALLIRLSLPLAALAAIPAFSGRTWEKRLRAIRTSWLEQFDCSQVIAISEFGLSCQTTEEPIFLPWSDILKISRTRELILFHVTSDLARSIILPRRIFANAADAMAFYHQALAFRTAALARPNLLDPVSFWEIA